MGEADVWVQSCLRNRKEPWEKAAIEMGLELKGSHCEKISLKVRPNINKAFSALEF